MKNIITKEVIVRIETKKNGESCVVAVEKKQGELVIRFLEDLNDCINFDPSNSIIVDDNSTMEVSYSRKYEKN